MSGTMRKSVLGQLRNVLASSFSLEQLVTLAWEMGVERDDLTPAKSAEAFARELVLEMARQDRLGDLKKLASSE